MVMCAVYGCKNKNKGKSDSGTESNISFLSFPIKKPKECKAWVVFCRRTDKFNCKTSRICSVHFEDSCFQWNLQHQLLNYSPKHARKVGPGSLPTLKGPKVSLCSAVTDNTHCERQLRGENRSAKKRKNELIASLTASSSTAITSVDGNSQNVFNTNEKDGEADATPTLVTENLQDFNHVAKMESKIEQHQPRPRMNTTKTLRKVVPGLFPIIKVPTVTSRTANKTDIQSEWGLMGKKGKNNVRKIDKRDKDAVIKPVKVVENSQDLNVAEMKAKIELLERENASLKSANALLLDKLKINEEKVNQLTKPKILYLIHRPLQPAPTIDK